MMRRGAVGLTVMLVGAAVSVGILARRLPPLSGAAVVNRAVAFPLVELQVTTRQYAVPEIFAALHPRVQLGDVVAIHVFGHFKAGLNPKEASGRFGEPSGHWTDPIWKSDSPYYDTSLARVSLGEFWGSDGKPGWKTVAYPKLTEVPAIILSEDLRRQIVAAVPETGEAKVVIAAPIGAGRVELCMT